MIDTYRCFCKWNTPDHIASNELDGVFGGLESGI